MAKPIEISLNAGVAEASVAIGGVLEALMNDGSADIIFGIDANVTSAQRRTLKPGEQYSARENSPIPCETLFYKAASGSQPFRAWGLKN